MNTLILSIILVPMIEIYLFIKIGAQIGAFNTILLIFFTAFVGIFYARYEGLNNFKSGFSQIIKKETPTYEIISGASIAIGALLLIIPGFFTDTLGFLLLIPLTRRILINFFINKKKINSNKKNSDALDGEIIEDKKDEL